MPTRNLFCTAILLLCTASPALAEKVEYRVLDPDVQAERLDHSPNESFLSMRADTEGRLFVGGREALFVYEPEPAAPGKFLPRRELYRFPPDSWVYDIEIRGHDLYVLTLSALYLIRNGVVDRGPLAPRRILWGIPRYHVHQCFHALAWGPEGDLYISLGDVAVHYGDMSRPDHWAYWTFFCPTEQVRIPYTGQGGVLRMKPDGGQLQVVSRGLRNCCGLAFDREWNLFGNDNDHESAPQAFVPGRLVHVTPFSDFGWPRGWMPHITPERFDLLDTMFDGMGRAVPVGQAYLDDSAWPDRLRNGLLVARWGIRALTHYPLERRGASFKTSETKLLEGLDQARPVGVTTAPGGRIYLAIAYMAHNEGSPVYPSDLLLLTPKNGKPPAIAPVDLTQLDNGALLDMLRDKSWDVRRRAHRELMTRDRTTYDAAVQRLETSTDENERISLIWLAGLSIAGRRADGSPDAVRDRLIALTRDPAQAIRLQAVRALGEYRANDPVVATAIAAALRDDSPAVAHAAIVASFQVIRPDWQQIAALAASRDSYLRQTACRLIASRGPRNLPRELMASDDELTRLAGTLAAGFRLTLPRESAEIPALKPLVPWPSPDVIQFRLADGTVDLRRMGRLGVFTLAEHWKSGGHTPDEVAAFDVLQERLHDPSEKVRLQAAHFLSLLNDARTEPAIAKLVKDAERRKLLAAPARQLNEAWIAGPFDDRGRGFETIHPPERSAIDLTADYIEKTGPRKWVRMAYDRNFDFRKKFEAGPDCSFYAYCRIDSPVRQTMMLLPGSDDGLRVWHNGKLVWKVDGTRGALPLQDVIYLDLEAGGNDLLFRVHNVEGECALYVHYRTLTEVSAALPEKISGNLGDRLKAAGSSAKIGPEFLSVDWSQAVLKGDPARGRTLFSAQGIGCAKCHAAEATSAASGGPSLAGAKARFTVPYLVESVLAPNKLVSPIFRATSLRLQDGRTVEGLVVGETQDAVEMLLTDATRKKFAKSSIEDRRQQETSPMPAGLVKTPDELRDLIAYLLSVP